MCAVSAVYERAGETISACGRYRYRLWRTWDATLPSTLWIMLNPSTADGTEDDPTIRKCVGFAKRWGCGSIEVINLFAFRATNPRELNGAEYAAGPGNGNALEKCLKYGPFKHGVAAWGAASKARKLTEYAAGRFEARWGSRRLECLGPTKSGQPRHPLMLAYATPLEPWPVA